MKRWKVNKLFPGRIYLGFIGILIIFASTYYVSYRIIVDASLLSVENKVSGEVSKMNKWVTSFEKTIEVLGASLTVQNDLSAIKDQLDVHSVINPALVDIYAGLSDDSGIFAYWQRPVGWRATEREWYKAAMAASGETVAITYGDFITGKMFAAFTKHIGKIEGLDTVLACDVELEELSVQVSLISAELYPGSYSFLTDENGHILTYSNNSMIDTESKIHYMEDHKGYKQYGLSNETVLIKDYDDVSRYIIPRKLDCGWILYTAIPKSAVTHLFNARIVWILLILLLLLLYTVYQKNRAVVISDAKSSFLSHVSHEIRTPMNAIIGLSELLLKRELTQDVYEDISKIKTAGESLLSLINNLLDLSVIESRKMNIVEAEYYLSSLLNDVITIIRLKSDEKNLLFKIDIDENTPGVLIGDETHIRQILINLLSNAVKYTNDGSIGLSVHSVNFETEALITIEISDTGIGINEENIPKLFDDFERFDTSKNVNVEGTGLGLAIVKKLCDLMGGKISVTSVYGKGSSFKVELKQRFHAYEKYTSGEISKDNARSFFSETFVSPETSILIVDDVPLNLEIATDFMACYEMDIDTCLSGAKAIEMLKSKQYDIVFLDHMMANMDGIETAVRIRALKGGAYKKLPLIALTANTSEDAKRILLRSGMNGFLAKPIESRRLNKILSKWIPEHKKEYRVFDTSMEKNNEMGEFVTTLTKIPALSVSRALDTFDGAQSSYEKIVRLTATTLPKSIEKLNSLRKMNTPLYRIEAHGIKSVLKNIGAYSIAEIAEKLEASCELHDLLNTEVTALIQALAPLIAKEENSDKPHGDLNRVYGAVQEIEELLDSFERDAALDAIAALTKYSYDVNINTVLSDITQELEMFNFREAKQLIKKIAR